jgi:hypothetical protein
VAQVLQELRLEDRLSTPTNGNRRAPALAANRPSIVA